MDKFVVFGFGSSGQRFASLIKNRHPSSELLVYSSQDLTEEPFASTSKLEEVAAFLPTIAVVCGPASDRLSTIQALPERIRGVLLEKPLGMDYPNGVQVKRALESRGACSQVGYNLRFSSSLNEFRTRVLAEDCGAVLSVRAETGQFLPTWRKDRDYRNTVSAREELGGGVLRELSHELDYLRWIFGEVEWVSAWLGKQSSLEMSVEDSAHVTLGFTASEGKSSTVAQLNLDFVRRDRVRSVTAICSEGSLRWDGIGLRVERWEADASDWQVVFKEGQGHSTYDLQWASFEAALENNWVPAVTVDDGLAVLRIIEAARASDRSRGIKTSNPAIEESR